jgi:hypothetical protein
MFRLNQAKTAQYTILEAYRYNLYHDCFTHAADALKLDLLWATARADAGADGTMGRFGRGSA